ncbi:hypothetical protein CRD59_00205 [Bifidobacterium xylocopae]|uniref:Uncharacterized protein n=2 Tax=Bifidobacterium xylocopae TaxID=2493119 RepID=A0A366KFB0_9BIFI|nr:hypothetical protein CRD59_00205 [Bifidobacterium xylocopae]
MIAKAVAHHLAQGPGGPGLFLSIKGPELLNKFVGESERLLRSQGGCGAGSACGRIHRRGGRTPTYSRQRRLV